MNDTAQAPETRTTAIIAAILRQLELRRTLLDRCDDVGEVVVTVKLEAGTTLVRSTAVTELHVDRRARQR